MSHHSAHPTRRIVAIRDPATISAAFATDQISVWVLPLDGPAESGAEVFSHLTSEERARAARYRSNSARRQFVSTRGLLRRILAAHLGISPLDVPIGHTGAGKPIVVGADLHFNVTHTEGLALVVFAERPVGIDVERIRDMSDPEGLVGRFFSRHEREAFLALPNELRRAGFFRGWTCKEALIKASGLSIAFLDGFDVELHPERPAALVAARHPVVASSAWSLAAWEPVGGYVAAVAIEGAGELCFDESDKRAKPTRGRVGFDRGTT